MLGVESGRRALEAARWWDAARDPAQSKNAAAEAGRKAVVVAGTAVVGAVGIVVNHIVHAGGEDGEEG
jgi:hypothetical protein